MDSAPWDHCSRPGVSSQCHFVPNRRLVVPSPSTTCAGLVGFRETGVVR
ncbi:hypothetical protein [Alloactinosynnema sp. L-07]|nr:hypothetical protein [Alloactinosynnema sp. L-07]